MSTGEILAPSPGDGRVDAAMREAAVVQSPRTDAVASIGARWLLPARVAWGLIAALSVVLFIYAVPATYDRLRNVLFVTTPAGRDITRQGLAQLGMSMDFYAGYNVAIVVLRTLVYFAAAAFIFARKSNDLMAYFVTIFLLTFSVGRMVQVLYTGTNPGLFPDLLIVIAYSSFVLFFYIFPNGRFVPGWTRLLAPVWVIVIALAFFFPDSPLDIRTYVPLGMALVTNVVLTLGAVAQIYRYMHAAGSAERQQIKWVTYGAAVILALNIIFTVAGLVDPNLDYTTSPSGAAALYQVLANTAVTVQLLIIPLALGITIMRYRLWDIDIIINRTLVYVPLTGIVAGLYSATVALFQKLFQTFTGSQSDIAIVLTTLILAALFTPLKNALQALVDRRFKESSDPTKGVRTLGREVARRIYALDAAAVTRRFFDEATAGFQTGGALYLGHAESGKQPIVYTSDGWQDIQAQVSVPLQAGDREVGKLVLGHRPYGRGYSARDISALQEAAGQIAAAIGEPQ